MIRLSRLADYAIVILTPMAETTIGDAQTQYKNTRLFSAHALAEKTGLSIPTVSKILKMLLKADLLTSTRGSQGGYRLAHPAHEITITRIIEAMDGPIAMTDCVEDRHDGCSIQSCCPTRAAWTQINLAIRDCLNDLTLADITRPLMFMPEEKRLEKQVA